MISACRQPHAVVTGASTGIGRATAGLLAGRGYHVYAGVRRPADAPPGTTALPLDVTDAGQIAAAAATVTEHAAAGLDALVNNAGIGVFGALELIGVDEFRRQLEINVTGQLAVTQAFLPLLRRARGRIVLVGSIGARFTPPFVGALAASKAALATLGEALRQELAPWSVRVALVEPGSIRTEAVGKLHRDAEQALAGSTPEYRGALDNLVTAFSAMHEKGSPPEVVARTVARALAARRPRTRYLSGRNAHRMALLAAVLPTPALDALRRRMLHQPAPGSRARLGGTTLSD
jgi:NAD(P)-dependent dehydrogenase (short-subunit alcohol dehydrogenase family)